MEQVIEIIKSLPISVFDLLFIGFGVLGLLIGLCGKFGKKFGHLFNTLACVAVAYFTCGMLTETIGGINLGGETVFEKVQGIIGNAVSGAGLNIDQELLVSLVKGIMKMVVFWVVAIALLFTLGFILRIITAIIFKKARKHTAVFSLGIFGAIRSCVIVLVFIFPIVAIAPATQSLSSLDAIKNNELAVTAIDQINKSKSIQFASDIFQKYSIEPLQYEIKDKDGNTKKVSLSTDLNAIGKMVGIASIFTGDSDNPLEGLLTMSKDDIKGIFNAMEESETVKTMVTDIVSGLVSQGSGDGEPAIDLSNIDLAKEGETFAAILDVIEINDQGEIAPVEFDLTKEEDIETVTNLASTLAQSEMVAELAATQLEGQLSSVDEDTKDMIETKMAEALGGSVTGTGTDKQITIPADKQDQFDKLMKLFASGSAD